MKTHPIAVDQGWPTIKISRIVSVGLLFTLSVANAAAAFSLSPTQTKFTLTGHATVAIGADFASCTITMTGNIPRNSKNAQIETFSNNGTCGMVATNLPWPVRAKDATHAIISNFAYTIPGNVCGGTSAHPTINSSGAWTLQTKVEGNTGPCIFRTTLTSIPPITIVP